jgi:8-oxo-dGTP diphosphatase
MFLFHSMRMISVATAIIKNENGEILLCKRTPLSTFPNKWEFPGGKSEANELPIQTLYREIYEELSIIPDNPSLYHSSTYTYPNSIHVHLSFFIILSWQGRLQNNIWTEIQWVPINLLHMYDILDGNKEVVLLLQSNNQ